MKGILPSGGGGNMSGCWYMYGYGMYPGGTKGK
eukprot:CAMPEP_0184364724 /NCGR_PEP_ID=MMETSP1089-20130417/145518_1 /TAXON_ID=38269 ORGANISM="Gloeochaete wittrockiana, Strain SAG46.84" /NCGR_SAMPLE_ID=MMETSP1089 /ASSEMBLY_ACC=CAM_ASM_000445 /LENGTH=32 /DNA_ID= /DNA_START= /DNA_END= /DNA_ORIENTATION=